MQKYTEVLKMLINIKKITLNKNDYMDLLLLADPSKKMVNSYLNKGEMFVLSVNGEAVCEAVVVKISDNVCELKNLATKKEYQGSGFGKQMLQHLFQYYKNTFNTMLVGTSSPTFYEKFGFEYSHTVSNFFIDNYDEPIIDNGVKCIDMTYLKKDLHTKTKAVTRSEESVMSLILDVAKKDTRVRAVCMNGSRVNSKAPKDFFQDYDIVFLVDDFDSFVATSAWLNVFGRRLIMQIPSQMGDNMKEVQEKKKITYLMQFVDGNRIDLTVLSYDKRNEYLKSDSLTQILLDKDNKLPKIPEASDKDYWIKKPTEKEYNDCCNEFWWISTYVAKGLWRKELLYATYHLETNIRKELLKMLRWKIAIENDFEVTTGKCDKYMENYLPKEMFDKLMRSFDMSDSERCWDSLFLMIDLFRRAASFVSEKIGYEYNSEDDKNVYAFLRHVRTLPRNARALYDNN